MKNLPLLFGTILGSLVLIFGVVFIFSKSSEPVVVDANLLTANAHNFTSTKEDKVIIVEFSDFQCPACRATQPLIKEAVALNPDKVKLIYRHYPLLSMHPNARYAAQAAQAAAKDGKFWEFHDTLFNNQDEWAQLKDEALTNQFVTYAQELGIDKVTFLSNIESDEVKAIVAEELSLGNQVKINATPTFFVNGELTPAPQLKSAVQSLLAN